ncbi:hypothetical protein CXF67_14605 [Psychroflexus sp. MES1-P1E]|nr:hypothetical protein CXF67_14605 [Psychroflexus sp. MES1-P1E]
MDIFKGRNLLKFFDRFKTDLDGKEYLSGLKKQHTYHCIKCNHNTCQIKIDFERQCNVSGHKESATANTLFHKVKFGIKKAFIICVVMSTNSKSLSVSFMCLRYGVTEKTARFFMLKVRESMSSSGNTTLDGFVHVDVFVLGGIAQGKV